MTEQSVQAEDHVHVKVFPSRAKEELYYAGKQSVKAIFITVLMAVALYLAKYFSPVLTFIFGAIGFIFFLASAAYAVGHFVRYLFFAARKQ